MLELVSFHTGVIFEVNILVIVGIRVRFAFWSKKDARFIFYGVAPPFNLAREVVLLQLSMKGAMLQI